MCVYGLEQFDAPHHCRRGCIICICEAHSNVNLLNLRPDAYAGWIASLRVRLQFTPSGFATESKGPFALYCKLATLCLSRTLYGRVGRCTAGLVVMFASDSVPLCVVILAPAFPARDTVYTTLVFH